MKRESNADKVIPPIYSDRLSQTVVRNYIKTSWRDERGEAEKIFLVVCWNGMTTALSCASDSDSSMDDHGKEQEDRGLKITWRTG